jgi:hypothetical protein
LAGHAMGGDKALGQVIRHWNLGARPKL